MFVSNEFVGGGACGTAEPLCAQKAYKGGAYGSRAGRVAGGGQQRVAVAGGSATPPPPPAPPQPPTTAPASFHQCPKDLPEAECHQVAE